MSPFITRLIKLLLRRCDTGRGSQRGDCYVSRARPGATSTLLFLASLQSLHECLGITQHAQRGVTHKYRRGAVRLLISRHAQVRETPSYRRSCTRSRRASFSGRLSQRATVPAPSYLVAAATDGETALPDAVAACLAASLLPRSCTCGKPPPTHAAQDQAVVVAIERFTRRGTVLHFSTARFVLPRGRLSRARPGLCRVGHLCAERPEPDRRVGHYNTGCVDAPRQRRPRAV